MAVEIFMPKFLRGLLGFYSTWIGKGVFYFFIAVLLLIPYNDKVRINSDKSYIYFIVVAVYMFVLAVFIIVLGILNALGVLSHRSSSIITKDGSSSSSTRTTKTTTTKTTTLNETLVEEN